MDFYHRKVQSGRWWAKTITLCRCITYNITGGTNNFNGAYGMMVDTFVSNRPDDPSAPFEINAWGIFYMND